MKGLTEQFADWVQQQPSGEAYAYSDTCGCALHRFLTSAGYPVLCVGGSFWRATDGSDHLLPDRLRAALVARPRTFGALAERLDSLRD